MKKGIVSILGCGWYGLALAKSLLADGYPVKGSTTSVNKLGLLKESGMKPFLINFAEGDAQFDADFFKCETLIICISPRKKNDEALDFASQIKKIGETASHGPLKNIILISSTGIYQDGNFCVDEQVVPEPTSDTGKTLLAAEKAFQQCVGFTTTIIRFGGLIGPERNLARHFAGKTGLTNGLAPINLIHLLDCIGLTKAILQKKAFGTIYHGVSPDHPTRESFYTHACLTTNLEKPEFRHELLDWKQIDSINVPKILGYRWKVSFGLI